MVTPCFVFKAGFLLFDDLESMSYRPPFPPATSVPVSLTRSGLPRIIPSFHRSIIRCRSSEGDILIRFYLSIFTVSKFILLAKPVSKSTFKTIIDPPKAKDMASILGVVSDLKLVLADLINRYTPWIDSLPLDQGLTFEPTWKSLPTHRTAMSVLVNRLGIKFEIARKKNPRFLMNRPPGNG